ncbi:hypothetical protein GT360_05540 [Vibrio astriarenae]|uniref:Uncharacterized protein n=1 Tax=Vibrio astriarenae TaxID=1481923 RepID=A0A7Z2T2E1_9VIBR|nr:hypothetical protein [Vibrio astriarenae]QIA63011.1 hypothetical protein GT360_05540 [Vibrio astriarenae]
MSSNDMREAIMDDLMKKVSQSHDNAKPKGRVTYTDHNGASISVDGVTEDTAEQIGMKYRMSGTWLPNQTVK